MPSIEEYILNFKLNFNSAQASLRSFVSNVQAAQNKLDEFGRKDVNVKVDFKPEQIQRAFDSALARSNLKANIDTALTITASSVNLKPLQDEITRKLGQVKVGNKSVAESLKVDIHLADTRQIADEINKLTTNRRLNIQPVIDPAFKSIFVSQLKDLVNDPNRKINIEIDPDDLKNLKDAGKAARELQDRNIRAELRIDTKDAQGDFNTFQKQNAVLETQIKFTEEEKGKLLKRIREVVESPRNLRLKTDNIKQFSETISENIERAASKGVKQALGKTSIHNFKASLVIQKISVPPATRAEIKRDLSNKIGLEIKNVDISKINILSSQVDKLVLTNTVVEVRGGKISGISQGDFTSVPSSNIQDRTQNEDNPSIERLLPSLEKIEKNTAKTTVRSYEVGPSSKVPWNPIGMNLTSPVGYGQASKIPFNVPLTTPSITQAALPPQTHKTNELIEAARSLTPENKAKRVIVKQAELTEAEQMGFTLENIKDSYSDKKIPKKAIEEFEEYKNYSYNNPLILENKKGKESAVLKKALDLGIVIKPKEEYTPVKTTAEEDKWIEKVFSEYLLPRFVGSGEEDVDEKKIGDLNTALNKYIASKRKDKNGLPLPLSKEDKQLAEKGHKVDELSIAYNTISKILFNDTKDEDRRTARSSVDFSTSLDEVTSTNRGSGLSNYDRVSGTKDDAIQGLEAKRLLEQLKSIKRDPNEHRIETLNLKENQELINNHIGRMASGHQFMATALIRLHKAAIKEDNLKASPLLEGSDTDIIFKRYNKLLAHLKKQPISLEKFKEKYTKVQDQLKETIDIALGPDLDDLPPEFISQYSKIAPKKVGGFGSTNFSGVENYFNLANQAGGIPKVNLSGFQKSKTLGKDETALYDSLQKEIVIKPEVLTSKNEAQRNAILAHELIHAFYEGYGKTLGEFAKNIESSSRTTGLKSIVRDLLKNKSVTEGTITTFLKELDSILVSTKTLIGSSEIYAAATRARLAARTKDKISSEGLGIEALQQIQISEITRQPKLNQLNNIKGDLNNVLKATAPDVEFTALQKQAMLTASQEMTASLVGVIEAGKKGATSLGTKDTSFAGGVGPELMTAVMERFGKIDVSSTQGLVKLNDQLQILAVQAASGKIDPLFEHLVKLINFLGTAANQLPNENSVKSFKTKTEGFKEEDQYGIMGVGFREQSLRTSLIQDQTALQDTIQRMSRLPELRKLATELQEELNKAAELSKQRKAEMNAIGRIGKSGLEFADDAEKGQYQKAVGRYGLAESARVGIERKLDALNSKIDSIQNPVSQLEKMRNSLSPGIRIGPGDDPSRSVVQRKAVDIVSGERSELKAYINQLKEAKALGQDFVNLLPKKIQDDIGNIAKLENRVKELNNELRQYTKNMKQRATEEIKTLEAAGKQAHSVLLAAQQGLSITRRELAEGLASGRFGTDFQPAVQAWRETDSLEQMELSSRHLTPFFDDPDRDNKAARKSRIDAIDMEPPSPFKQGSYEAQIAEQRKLFDGAVADSKRMNDQRMHSIKIIDEESNRIRFQQHLWIENGRVVAVNANQMRSFESATRAAGNTMQRTIQRVIQWGSASYAVYSVFNAFRQAKDVIVEFNKQITIMRSLTNSTTESLKGITDVAVGIGREFGKNINEVVGAMNEFLRQGIQMADVTEATRNAMLLSNVAMIDAAEANKLLIAVTKQFNMSAEDYGTVIDKITALGDAFAVSAQDIAHGMSRSGSTAKTMGLELDQLGAIIATVGEATQKTGNEVGTSFRTILSRGISSNAVKLFKTLGIEVFGTGGQIKAFGEVIDEVGGKWDGFTKIQQASIAKALGGRVRLNDVFSLFENYDRYLQGVTISQDSMGSSSTKNAILMESMAKKMESAKTAVQGLVVTLGSGGLGAVVTTLTTLINGLTDALNMMNSSMGGLLAPGAGMLGMTGAGMTGLSIMAQNMGMTGIGQGAFKLPEKETIFTGMKNSEVLQYYKEAKTDPKLYEKLDKMVEKIPATGNLPYQQTAQRITMANRVGMVAQMFMSLAKFTLLLAGVSVVLGAIMAGYRRLTISTQELVDKNNILTARLKESETAFKNVVISTKDLKVVEGEVVGKDDQTVITKDIFNKLATALLKNTETFGKYLDITVGQNGSYGVSVRGGNEANPLQTINKMMEEFQKAVVDQSLKGIDAFSTSGGDSWSGAYKGMRNGALSLTDEYGGRFETNQWESLAARNMAKAWQSRDLEQIAEASQKLSEEIKSLRENTQELFSLRGLDIEKLYGDKEQWESFSKRITTVGEQLASLPGNLGLTEKGNESQLRGLGFRGILNDILKSQNVDLFEESDLVTNQSAYSKFMGSKELNFDETGNLEKIGSATTYAFGKINDETGNLIDSQSQYEDILSRVGNATVAFITSADKQTGQMVLLGETSKGVVSVIDEQGNSIRRLADNEFPNVILLANNASKAFGTQAAAIEGLMKSFERLKQIMEITNNQFKQIEESANSSKFLTNIQTGMLGYTSPEAAQVNQQSDFTKVDSLVALAGTNRNIMSIAEQNRNIMNYVMTGQSESKILQDSAAKANVNLPELGIEGITRRALELFTKVENSDIKPNSAEGRLEVKELVQSAYEIDKLKPALVAAAEANLQGSGKSLGEYIDSQNLVIKAAIQSSAQMLTMDYQKGDAVQRTQNTAAQDLVKMGILTDDRTNPLNMLMNDDFLAGMELYKEETGSDTKKETAFSMEDIFNELLSKVSTQGREALLASSEPIQKISQELGKVYEERTKAILDYAQQYGTLEAQIDPARADKAASYNADIQKMINDTAQKMYDKGQYSPALFKSQLDALNNILAVNKQIAENTLQLKNTATEGKAGLGTLEQQASARRTAAEQERLTLFKEMDLLEGKTDPESNRIRKDLQSRIDQNSQYLDLGLTRNNFEIPGVGNFDLAGAARYLADVKKEYGELPKNLAKLLQEHNPLDQLYSSMVEDDLNQSNLNLNNQMIRPHFDGREMASRLLSPDSFDRGLQSEEALKSQEEYNPATAATAKRLRQQADMQESLRQSAELTGSLSSINTNRQERQNELELKTNLILGELQYNNQDSKAGFLLDAAMSGLPLDVKLQLVAEGTNDFIESTKNELQKFWDDLNNISRAKAQEESEKAKEEEAKTDEYSKALSQIIGNKVRNLESEEPASFGDTVQRLNHLKENLGKVITNLPADVNPQEKERLINIETKLDEYTRKYDTPDKQRAYELSRGASAIGAGMSGVTSAGNPDEENMRLLAEQVYKAVADAKLVEGVINANTPEVEPAVQEIQTSGNNIAIALEEIATKISKIDFTTPRGLHPTQPTNIPGLGYVTQKDYPDYYGVPKKHSGGLAMDEYMAILQKGEAVIPRNLVNQIPDEVISRLPKHHGGLAPYVTTPRLNERISAYEVKALNDQLKFGNTTKEEKNVIRAYLESLELRPDGSAILRSTHMDTLKSVIREYQASNDRKIANLKAKKDPENYLEILKLQNNNTSRMMNRDVNQNPLGVLSQVSTGSNTPLSDQGLNAKKSFDEYNERLLRVLNHVEPKKPQTTEEAIVNSLSSETDRITNLNKPLKIRQMRTLQLADPNTVIEAKNQWENNRSTVMSEEQKATNLAWSRDRQQERFMKDLYKFPQTVMAAAEKEEQKQLEEQYLSARAHQYAQSRRGSSYTPLMKAGNLVDNVSNFFDFNNTSTAVASPAPAPMPVAPVVPQISEEERITALSQANMAKVNKDKALLDMTGMSALEDFRENKDYIVSEGKKAVNDFIEFGVLRTAKKEAMNLLLGNTKGLFSGANNLYAGAKDDLSEMLKKKFGFFHNGGLLNDEYMAILQKGEAVIPRDKVGMIPQPLLDSLPKHHNGVMDSISRKAFNSIPKYHNGTAPQNTNTLDYDISGLVREINNLSNVIKESAAREVASTGDGNSEAMTEMFKLLYDGILELKNSNTNLGSSIAESITTALQPSQENSPVETKGSSNSNNRVDVFINGETKLEVDVNGNEINGITNDVVERVIEQIRNNPNLILRMLENQPIIGME